MDIGVLLAQSMCWPFLSVPHERDFLSWVHLQPSFGLPGNMCDSLPVTIYISKRLGSFCLLCRCMHRQVYWGCPVCWRMHKKSHLLQSTTRSDLHCLCLYLHLYLLIQDLGLDPLDLLRSAPLPFLWGFARGQAWQRKHIISQPSQSTKSRSLEDTLSFKRPADKYFQLHETIECLALPRKS